MEKFLFLFHEYYRNKIVSLRISMNLSFKYILKREEGGGKKVISHWARARKGLTSSKEKCISPEFSCILVARRLTRFELECVQQTWKFALLPGSLYHSGREKIKQKYMYVLYIHENFYYPTNRKDKIMEQKLFLNKLFLYEENNVRYL